jgi:hypothetical protein
MSRVWASRIGQASRGHRSALVVGSAYRSGGVGKDKMVTAEAWVCDRGFTSVAFGSSVTRPEAHAFYEAIGYRRTATSHLFRKDFKPQEWNGRNFPRIPSAIGMEHRLNRRSGSKHRGILR